MEHAQGTHGLRATSLTTWLHRGMCGALLLSIAWSALGILSQPTEELLNNFVVDDAVYYIKPAQNFWAGRDYSFDGEGRSNGVQPLWAILALLLVKAVPDTAAAVRTLCVLSAGCWFAAGFVLYRVLAARDRWAALFLAAGWCVTAFAQHVAFQGMENGLHALLLALLLGLALRQYGDDPSRRLPAVRFYLRLGLSLGLFTLTRVDSGLMALLTGGAVLLGLLRAGETPRWALRLGPALLVALPGVVLIGGISLLNHFYFESAAPISGRVKLHYSSLWSYAQGNVWQTLWAHYLMVWNLSFTALTSQLDRALYVATGVTFPERYARRIVLLVAAFLLVGAAARAGRTPGHLWRNSLLTFAVVLTLFVLLRTTIYAVTLSNFTPYCTWYLAPELMLLWVALALGLRYVVAPQEMVPASGAPRRAGAAPALFAALTLLLLFVQFTWAISPPRSAPRTNALLRAADWFDNTQPAGRRIGAFSSGILGGFIHHHQVFNLDGLINTRSYFEKYIRTGQQRRYAAEQRLDYLADYATAQGWRSFWNFKLEQMELVRWWPMNDGLRYCVWRLLPLDSRRDLLDPCIGPCDRLSQIQFSAEAEQRFPLVEAAELTAYLQAQAAKAPRVLCSLVEPDGRAPRHVVVPAEEARALRLRPADADIPIRADLNFGGALRLHGVELVTPRVQRRGTLILTYFWERVQAEPDLKGVVLETWIYPADPRQLTQTDVATRVIHSSRGAHGTYAPADWELGELVVETLCLTVPPGLQPGSYPITIGVYSPVSGWLLPNRVAPDGRPTAFVENVQIE